MEVDGYGIGMVWVWYGYCIYDSMSIIYMMGMCLIWTACVGGTVWNEYGMGMV